MTERDVASPDAPVRRDHHEGDGASRGTARMEAFADAVFAIALTLPVVEIRIPKMDDGSHQLAAGLRHLWPGYVGYGIAVVVIGLYWVHHHFSGAIYRTTGHYFLLATTLFLAAIGFIAFPSRTFADSLTHPQETAAAARYLLVCLLITQVTWLLKWRVGRATGHVDARLDPAYVARLDRGYVRVTVALAVATGLSFVIWQVGAALATAVFVFFVRAPETPRYLTEAPLVEVGD